MYFSMSQIHILYNGFLSVEINNYTPPPPFMWSLSDFKPFDLSNHTKMSPVPTLSTKNVAQTKQHYN